MNVADAKRDKRMPSPLKTQRGTQASARAVAAGNLSSQSARDSWIAAGLHRVGFSPMFGAPTGEGEMQSGDFEPMLGEMETAGRSLAGAAHG